MIELRLLLTFVSINYDIIIYSMKYDNIYDFVDKINAHYWK